MNDLNQELDLAGIAETHDLECKSAQGRDGRGELPEDFWKSYSAMANADGGFIFLGIQEKPRGQFNILGLAEPDRVRKTLWDMLHNRNKISVNLLSEAQVRPVSYDDKTVLRIEVPRAARKQRPVHIGSNPFGGTYLRRHEGDYQVDDESVRRMLAERVEDSRDERVLKGYDFTDLDMDTVLAYRNRFSAVKPGHAWLDLQVPEFLERIGAYGRNREEGFSGLRLAGLLMFGRAEVIRDELPHYMVDYQERPEPRAERRWIDRLVPDGTWSGNLYDFFRRVYQKLTADLKVPFQLQAGQRIEDTPVHEALREALANTLVHADFSGRVSVLVVKRPDMFGFRNPGLMRIPPALAVQGGNSDCRNRRLQTMFQLVGYGDHAGSGLPKIYRNWQGQHWRRPSLYEVADPEQTLMELRMTSLVPDEVLAELQRHLGEKFAALSELERLTMVTAVAEGVVNHSRVREVSTDHPADITKMLAHLVKEGVLVSDGVGRGMVYFVPWHSREGASLFPSEEVSADETLSSTATLPPQSPLLAPQLPSLTPQLPSLTPQLDNPDRPAVISDLSQLTESELGRLREIASPIASRQRSKPSLVQQTVLALCRDRYLGLRVLIDLLGRNQDGGKDLRKRILNPMVADGRLQRAFPNPSDPRQAYKTTDV
jgi:ATP-dependent DNA helicase RecG